MLEAKLVLDRERVIIAGRTWSSIQKKIADRLGCETKDLVFKQKQNKDGKLEVIHVSSHEDWKHFQIKGFPIDASSGDIGKKRKLTAYEVRRQVTTDSELSSSFDTPPKPSAPKKSRSSDGSNGNASGYVKSRMNPSIDYQRAEGSGRRLSSLDDVTHSSRKMWTPKDEKILWDHFTSLVASMPHPDPVYTSDQKRKLFEDISKQAFRGKRKVNSIRTQLGLRIRNAALRGELSLRHKAVFPVIASRHAQGSSQIIIDDSDVEDEDTFNENISSSSDSEDTPPLPTRTVAKAGPAAIRPYNPFITGPSVVLPKRPVPSAAPPMRVTPSSNREGREPAPASISQRQNPLPPGSPPGPPSLLLALTRSLSSSASSIGVGQDRPSQVGSESDRSSVTLQPSRPINVPANSNQSRAMPQQSSQTGASVSSTHTTPLVVSPSQPLANRVGYLSLGEVSSQTTRQETGQDTDDAIVVKDESEDELMNEDVALTRSNNSTNNTQTGANHRMGSVKREHQSIREDLRGYISPLFPIQSILTLPPITWAVSLATWIRLSALQGVIEPVLRQEILAACFDEFFYYSYRTMNPGYSIQRATVGISLLFLDLCHALGDIEEVQGALVEIFYDRIFSSQAPRPDVSQEWPKYDLLASVSLIFPSRPNWLLTFVFERCNHFRIEEVPPPVEKVTLIFERLQLLLQKLSACLGFFEKESDLKLLCKSVHRPFVDSTTLSNLQALHRQARLSPSDKVAFTNTLTEIDRLKNEASIREVEQIEAEDKFIGDRLLLVSSPYFISIQVITDLIETYSLSTQIRNGPLRKKFDSTRETWHLYILQFSKENKQRAIANLRDRSPSRDVQILERSDQIHSMCPSISQDEMKKWHRLRCDLHLHRDHHHKCVKRVKQEPPAPIDL